MVVSHDLWDGQKWPCGLGPTKTEREVTGGRPADSLALRTAADDEWQRGSGLLRDMVRPL